MDTAAARATVFVKTHLRDLGHGSKGPRRSKNPGKTGFCLQKFALP
jgi:hypothetical protein